MRLRSPEVGEDLRFFIAPLTERAKVSAANAVANHGVGVQIGLFYAECVLIVLPFCADISTADTYHS